MKRGILILLLITTINIANSQVTRLVHPGVLFDRQDLDRMKANYKTTFPWKDGFAALISDSRASQYYVMKGPFSIVGREPNLNLRPYEDDAMAAFYQAIQWYLTGKEIYAKNAQHILESWAITQSQFTGGTPRLTAGPTGMYQAAAAEILRYTYPGWSQDNTDHLVKYFKYVVWPYVGGDTVKWTVPNLNTANQSALQLRGTIAIAAFCDDVTMFNNAVDAFRNHSNGGIMYNTLPNGQIGDFGRDQGHAGGQIGDHGLGAEMILKQGIDVWADRDNRLLKCMEYYCKANLKIAYPEYYVWGPAYDVYTGPNYGDNYQNKNFKVRYDFNLHNAMEIFDGAYRKWKRLETPYIRLYQDSLNKTMGRGVESLLYYKDDHYKPAKAIRLMERQWLFADKEVKSLQITSPASVSGVAVYQNDSWIINDFGQSGLPYGTFAYQSLTGDGTFVARVVASAQNDTNQTAGIMIRSSTHADSAFVSVKIKPGSKGIMFEGRSSNGERIISQQVKTACIPPYWLKLERRGNEVIAFTSPDGATWAVCSFRFTACYLPKTIKAGLFVAAGAKLNSTAIFDHVEMGIGGKAPVPKKYQTIDFNNHTTGALYELNKGIPLNPASASSGLPITYISENQDIVRVESGQLKAIAPGKVKVFAYQQGNDVYYATGRVPYVITILP